MILSNGILTVTEKIESKEDWDELKKIYEEEFSRAKEIRLPDSLTEIYDNAFKNCKILEKIDVPCTVIGIGHSAFDFCINLRHINLPDSVTFIDAFAFCQCHSLKEITIPPKVTLISSGAFCMCANLESVKISDSVKYIESDAFNNCDKLCKLKVPLNCFIAPRALIHCDNLTVQLGNKSIPGSYFDHFDTCLFFKKPSFERMLKIPLPEIKINIAIMYMDSDRRFVVYLRRHIADVIDRVAKKEDVQVLDKLIEYKIIDKNNVDDFLDGVLNSNFNKSFIALTQFKNETGGYNKNNQERFDL